MGLHQFVLGQNTSAAWKVLMDRVNKHQVITGGGAALYLADTATLTAPDGVSLPDTLSMAQGAHARLRVVLVNLFGPYHPAALAMRDVNMKIMER